MGAATGDNDRHAATALGEVSGMKVLACPVEMPRYPITCLQT